MPRSTGAHSSSRSAAPPPVSTRLTGRGPCGWPPGAIAWPVDSAPAIAALWRSCATPRATPSWIRGIGDFGTPSASNARGSVEEPRGESARLIDGAVSAWPSRPVSAPRPSAWASPLRAVSPRRSRSQPTAWGSMTTGYSPGGRSAGPPGATARDGNDLHEGVGGAIEARTARGGRERPLLLGGAPDAVRGETVALGDCEDSAKSGAARGRIESGGCGGGGGARRGRRPPPRRPPPPPVPPTRRQSRSPASAGRPRIAASASAPAPRTPARRPAPHLPPAARAPGRRSRHPDLHVAEPRRRATV